MQLKADVLPVLGLDVPGGHKGQLGAPFPGLNDPEGHNVQLAEVMLPVDGLYVPAVHK